MDAIWVGRCIGGGVVVVCMWEKGPKMVCGTPLGGRVLWFTSGWPALVVALEPSKCRLYKGHQNVFDQMHIFYNFNFSLKIRPGKILNVKKFWCQNVKTVKYSDRLFVRIFLCPNFLVINVNWDSTKDFISNLNLLWLIKFEILANACKLVRYSAIEVHKQNVCRWRWVVLCLMMGK